MTSVKKKPERTKVPVPGHQQVEPTNSAILRAFSELNLKKCSCLDDDDQETSGDMQQLRNRRITPTSSMRRKSTRARSAFGQGKDHCLCVIMKPIIRLGQFSGTLPVTRHPETCSVSCEWKSIPMAVNIWCSIFNVIGGLLWYPIFYKFLRRNFSGTDFYTHCIAITVQTISSFVLYFAGRLVGVNFAKAWPKLHDTVNEMGLPCFKGLKYAVYLIPWYLAQEFCLNAFYMLGELYYDNWEWDSLTLQIRMSIFLANLIPNLCSLTFALLIMLASQNFKGINRQLTELQVNHFNRFQPSPAISSEQEDMEIVVKLARLRILHENLCEAVRKIETAFGTQMQAIFAATCVSFLVGIYNLILDLHGIWDESEDRIELFFRVGSASLMPILAGIRVAIIVLCGQALTNNANEAGHILSGFNIINASEEAKLQVRKFLDKIGMFPVQLSADGIIELGASFLGPAMGNLVTYILVMMQFRLDDDPNPSMGPGNGTITKILLLTHDSN